MKSIIHAVNRWAPDFLVCTDDLAVRRLQTLYHLTSDDTARQRISDLIELSLGPTASFSAIRDKSEFLALAELEGLRCPRTVVVPAGHSLASIPADLAYPLVVKADRSEGGRCVRIVNCAADVRRTVWELQTSSTWRDIFRETVGTMLGAKSLSALRLPLRRTVSLQQFVPGRPSNRAVACWKGRVLAGASVEAVQVRDGCGPASVIKVIDHPEMTYFAERMVNVLGLSGFIGFDFVLDSLDQAWLIEMNPRVTPISHLSLANGGDLAASLYSELCRAQPLSRGAPISSNLVALFPEEIARAPSSEYLKTCYHDVPWEEPELVLSVLSQALRTSMRSRIFAFLRRVAVYLKLARPKSKHWWQESARPASPTKEPSEF